jgi:4-amino-4-deoxy-L-arabinose transferase-like glycosyltransferase
VRRLTAHRLTISRKWLVIGAVVVALARTAAIGVLSSPTAPLVGDEPHYDALARSLLAGQGLTYHGQPLPYRAPGYPVVLAGIYSTLGDDRRTVAVVQGLLDAGTAILTAAVAAWMFRSTLAGALAFLLVMAWPSFVQTSLSLYAESLFTVGAAAIVAGFARFHRAPTWRWAIATGVLAGVVTLVRPTALSLVAGLGLGWVIVRIRREWRQFPKLVAMGLAAGLTAAPSALYNQQHYGVLSPGAIHGGEQFLLGALLETKGRWEHEKWYPIREAVTEAEARRLGHTLTPGEQQDAYFKAGLEIWRQHPLESIEIAVRRVWRLVLIPLGGTDLPLVRVGFFSVLVALYALAWPPAIAGFHTDDPGRSFAAVMTVALLWSVVTLSVMFTLSRYFEPIRPMVMILACGTVAAWLERRGVTAMPLAGR